MAVYVFDRPVVGPGAFFGREVLLRSLRDAVRHGRSVIVCGGPLTGRTSTLLELARLLRDGSAREQRRTRVVPVVIDAASPPGRMTTQATHRYADALDAARRASAVATGAVAPSLTAPLRRPVAEPWKALRDSLAELERAAAGTSAWGHHAWLVDNADHLLEAGREDELGFVRDLAQAGLPGGPVAVVLAGGRRLRESLAEARGPFAGLRALALGALDEGAARALARRGVRDLEPPTVAELLRLSGRHPWVLQRLLADLEAQPTAPDLDEALRQVGGELETLWQRLWDELDLGRALTYRGAYAAPEHAFLQLLVEGDAAIDVALAERQLGLRPLRETAECLEYLGLAERRLKADTPVFRALGALFGAWYGERVLA